MTRKTTTRTTTVLHPDHAKNVAKLNRAIGQLNGVKTMIEERRYCVDIVTQLHAARAALQGIEQAILEKHIGHCVKAAATGGKEADAKLAELNALLKRYLA